MDRQQSELIENEVVLTNEIPEPERRHAFTPMSKVRQEQRQRVDLRTASADEIRADIERTRAEMDTTIDRLNARLKPRHLLDDVLNMFGQGGAGEDEGTARRSMREAGTMAADKLKQNPVPATLIGAGLAWLLFKDNHSSTTARAPRGLADAYYDPPAGESDSHGLAEGLKDASGSLKHKAQDALHGAQAAAHRAGNSASHAATGTKNMLGELVESSPLALGVGALAAGLISGLLLPGTRAEDKLMGETSDELKNTARNVGNAVADEAKEQEILTSQNTGKLDRMWDR